MADLSKTINGLECLFGIRKSCTSCPYEKTLATYNNCVSFVAADALELLKAQEWISVKKDLPGISCMVLITGKNGAGGSFGVVKGMYTHKKGWYRDDIGQFADGRGDVITHWMPLPEPPKEET